VGIKVRKHSKTVWKFFLLIQDKKNIFHDLSEGMWTQNAEEPVECLLQLPLIIAPLSRLYHHSIFCFSLFQGNLRMNWVRTLSCAKLSSHTFPCVPFCDLSLFCAFGFRIGKDAQVYR
jgi:hypothetical protein